MHPMRNDSLHEDRQTDMTKVAVTFHNFAKAPEKEIEVLEPNTMRNVEYICTNHVEVA
jgi:hypothetical protein